MGINGIYPWQSNCLLGEGILEGRTNLVHSAPTGGGKSLVAGVLMLKQVLSQSRKKAILVLPYAALVQEKLQWLRRLVEGVTRSPSSSQGKGSVNRWRASKVDFVCIGGFHGGNTIEVDQRDVDLAVCTIEKVS
jgi:ATP-dependent helicase YprA (DUF1998 family)